MRRKKRVYTRRQMALRRIAQAVICLLAVNHLCMFFFFLPGQAVRYEEEEKGVYDAKVIVRDWTPEFTKVMDYETADFIYLTANDRALCFSTMDHSMLYGWQAQSSVLECSGRKAFFADWSAVEIGNWEREVVFFGRVDDYRIRRVEFKVEELAEFVDEGETAKVWTLMADDFIEKDGRRYLYERMDWVSQIEASAYKMTATAYDAAGNVVERQELPY